MKRMLILLCAIALAATGAALAEGATELPVKALIELSPNGASIDLDGDGQADAISLTEAVSDAGEAYELTVNGQTLAGSGEGLNGMLYAMRLTEADRAYLLVSEDGPSDDPANYVYRYKEGVLEFCGTLPAWAESIAITDEGFTATVRGRVIQTWFRRADFVVTDNSFFDDATGEFTAAASALVEVPRDVYAMGTVVTLKKDLTLQVSRQNAETALMLKAGEKAVIVATDDVEWLYIQALDEDYARDYSAGWLRLADAWDVEIDGDTVSTMDVFSGLLYAD
jgi:hypothetical protein